ncbi:MAG: UDP-N-acetylmuramoyl-tripeptide--D-alanyl-D-alanine ligase [Bacteroidales bacterium]|nr:UDP-N-acetylmuramoyl-tripeptide--D-alanyl-D-alanine ligase [Candidatus Physcousia equi]
MTLTDIYEIYKQHPIITTDTRQCEKGSVFFALKGASFDGNQFASKALEAGCAYAVVDDKSVVEEGDARYIQVDNVLDTLQQLAQLHRKSLSIPILQITGTNGKTTTKELVSAVLAKKFNVLFTQGNLNNHIGVPRTLLRIRPEHEVAVVETGANHPGEIAFLCQMVQADYGLITNVGRAHLEGFGSFEGVKRTKGELYDDLKKRGCKAFLNEADDDLRGMAQERGLGILPYVEGCVKDCSSFLTVQWRENHADNWHCISTKLVGAYNIANVRAAISVGLAFSITPADINDAISEYTPTNSRSEFRLTPNNKLIVDAYNANPSSMKVALDNFELISEARKMVILGMMAELGEASRSEHETIIDRLLSSQTPGTDKFIDRVWLVGGEFAKVMPQPSPQGWHIFADAEEVKERLKDDKPQGYIILIKGSNSQKLFQLPDLL